MRGRPPSHFEVVYRSFFGGEGVPRYETCAEMTPKGLPFASKVDPDVFEITTSHALEASWEPPSKCNRRMSFPEPHPRV